MSDTETIWSLYKITAPDGRAYIGVAKNVGERWRAHCRRASLVGNAIRQFGADAMRLEVLETGSRIQIYQREPETIAALNTRWPNGFNLASGGTGGRDPLPRTREKISRSLKGRPHPPRSAEYRANISAAQKGKIISAEQRVKMSARLIGKPAWNKGISPSAEHRANLSAALMGRPAWNKGKPGKSPSAEHRAMISAAHKGKTVSALTRQRQSAALKGKVRGPLSQDVRAKLSAANKGKPWSAARRAAQLQRQQQPQLEATR